MASTSRKRHCTHKVSEEDIVDILYASDDSDDSTLFGSEDDDENIDDYAVRDAVLTENVDKDGDSDNDDNDTTETFVWEDMKNYNGKRENFTGGFGPQNNAKHVTDIVDCFELFFDRELVGLIVEETNRYADQFRQRGLFARKSPVRAWSPVTEGEIYVVLGLFMLMGIIQKPTLRSYFSTKRVISTPGFADVISRDRFELICKFLHFSNNDEFEHFRGPKKLFKIFPIISHLNSKFQDLFLPQQNISIDESLTLWKGRLSIKQFLPLKSSKFGIKTFELCDSITGYLWSFLVYTGKDMNFESPLITEKTNKTAAIVLKLVEPLLNEGRTVWMDNYYNSPYLAKFLKQANKTDCVGTLKLNRKDVPKKVKTQKLKKGEIVTQHSGPVSVMKWKDKKEVSVISTYHDHKFQTETVRGKEKSKPNSVLDYNKYMGGVDLKDQLLQSYLVERKRMNKWYMKLFRRLLNTTILNSMILFRENTKKKIDHLSFRIQLVEGLFVKYGSVIERKVPGRHSSDNTVPRLTDRHFISKIPPTEKKARPQRRCAVCQKHGKRKDTVYWCEDCDVGLCVECFKDYHTKLNY